MATPENRATRSASAGLRAAPDVLDYVVAAHPLVILQLIRERDSARYALHRLRQAWEEVGAWEEIASARRVRDGR